MTAFSAAVVWFAGRAFRVGALSFGRLDRGAVIAVFTGRNV